MALQFPRSLIQPYANDPLAFTPVAGSAGSFDPADPVFYGTGTNTSNSGAGSVTLGQGAVTTGGNFATAVGRLAKATATLALAYGPGTLCSGVTGIAIGSSGVDSFAAQVTTEGGIAIGSSNSAGTIPGARATVGAGLCIGSASAAFGAARSSAEGAVALGCGGTVGNGARATGANSFAVGQGTVVAGVNGTAVGQTAVASATNAQAYGQSANATAADAMAFGRNTIANALRATAFGLGTTNQFPDSFAFGSNGLEIFRLFDPLASGNFAIRMQKSVQAGAAFTLTPALGFRGYIECTFAGAITITMDTAANYDASFTQAYDNMSFFLNLVPSNALGNITLVMATGFTAKSPIAALGANRPVQLMIHRTAAGAYDVIVMS